MLQAAWTELEEEEWKIDKDRNTDKGRQADVFHPCEGEIGN